MSSRPGHAARRGFVDLYNKKDLTGWAVKDGKLESWKAEGPILACVAGGGGWLRTEKEYADFELQLEYKIPAGGNSGVGLRFPLVGDPAHIAMEIQILDDDHEQYKNLNPAQYTGGIYYQVAPKKKAIKPSGEWNKFHIVCNGPEVRIKLNGVEIINANMDRETVGHGNRMPLSQRPRSGFLGFQSHGSRVEFRNVRIKVLASQKNNPAFPDDDGQ